MASLSKHSDKLRTYSKLSLCLAGVAGIWLGSSTPAFGKVDRFEELAIICAPTKPNERAERLLKDTSRERTKTAQSHGFAAMHLRDANEKMTADEFWAYVEQNWTLMLRHDDQVGAILVERATEKLTPLVFEGIRKRFMQDFRPKHPARLVYSFSPVEKEQGAYIFNHYDNLLEVKKREEDNKYSSRFYSCSRFTP